MVFIFIFKRRLEIVAVVVVREVTYFSGVVRARGE